MDIPIASVNDLFHELRSAESTAAHGDETDLRGHGQPWIDQPTLDSCGKYPATGVV